MTIKGPLKDVPLKVVLLALAHGLDHIYMISLPALFPLLQRDLGLTYTQLGFLVSMRGIFGFLQPVAGFLVDRWGAKSLLAWCYTIMGLSFLGLASSPAFIFLLIFQFLVGIGSTVVHPASYSLVGRIKGQPLGRKMAFHSFFGFLGTTIGLAVIGTFGSLLGWRWTLALLSLPGFLATYFLLKASFPPSIGKKIPMKKVERGVVNPLYPLLVIGVAGAFQGMFSSSLSSFLPTFLTGIYGYGVAEAGFYSSILFVGGLIGLLAGGEIVERVDRVLLISILSLGVTILIIGLSLIMLPASLLVLLLLSIGFCKFFANPSRLSLTTEISPVGAEGRAFGLTFGLSFAGGALAAPVTGFLADTFGIQQAFLFISVVALLAGITILFLKRWRYGHTERFAVGA